MDAYRARIEMGNLDGETFLDLQFADDSPYPVQYKRIVVPVVCEPLNSYRESSDVELFLDFRRAIVPGAVDFEKVYDCRTNQAALLMDLEAAVRDKVEDALTCRPELFQKPEDFVFRSSAGIKKSSGGIPDGCRRVKGRPGPTRYKGIGDE